MGSLLAGIRVLDVAGQLGIPWLGRHMAHHGAEVVTVETSRFLPKVRQYVAPNAPDLGVQQDGSPSLTEWHSGKLSVGLDLTEPEAQRLFSRLVSVSDVVLSNRLPRAAAVTGVTYPLVSAVNPSIIMVHNTSYGLEGSYANNGAFGDHIEAVSGISHLLRDPETNEPGATNTLLVDYMAGLHGLFAVLEAIRSRRETGRGQFIDLSMLEVAVSSIGDVVTEFAATGQEPPPGNDVPGAAPYGCYPCDGGERDCVISVSTDDEWASLCTDMGRPEWVSDTRFATHAARKSQQKLLDDEIGKWTHDQSGYQLTYRLQGLGIRAGMVQGAKELIQDPQLQHRRFFTTYRHPSRGGVIGTGLAVSLEEPDDRALRTGFALGEDTGYLLGELLGVEADELSRLADSGVIDLVQPRVWPGDVA